ncbi:MAG TPA: hypothetical protein VHG08_19690 [Longimicrobium sp.]|nr:hypothetical protein [Longimicrobium sp.]
MRFTYLAAVASLATLAACGDAPITQAEPTDAFDMSKVTLITPDQYAARGISPTPTTPSALGATPLFAEEPCYIEPCPEPDPTPPPVAYVDFWGGVFNESVAGEKRARLHAKSDAHNNMDQTILSISYRSVGGCSATPAQFDSDYKVAYGAPVHVVGERYFAYATTSFIRWEVKSTHKFTANAGYVLPNGYRTYTWGSGGRVCI